jgi:hypothetical protein
MNSSMVRKAEAGRRFGLAVMLAGLVAVLSFLAQSVLLSARISQFDGQLQAGLLVAVIGFGAMMIGAGMVRRQMVVLEVAERERRDGLRRAAQYYDGERIEPYIGPGLPGGPQVIRDE